MDLNTLYSLKKDENMHKYLRDNSHWYKYLNRSGSNYNLFKNAMKKQYRLGITDKISDTIENIDMITSILNTIK